MNGHYFVCFIKITATSLVTSFNGPSEWGGRKLFDDGVTAKYMCGTGPLVEEYSVLKSDLRHVELLSFNVMRGARNVNRAIESFKSELHQEQPPCVDVLHNCKFLDQVEHCFWRSI